MNNGSGGFLWLVVIVMVVGLVVALVAAYRQAESAFKARVGAINAEHTLAFATKPMLGSHSNGLLFDRENRKILYLVRATAEVLDYGYFTRWRYQWDTRTNGRVEQRRVALDTTDFDRPQLSFPVGSDAEGEEWVARLDVAFNRE